jgi:hypothetical protein
MILTLLKWCVYVSLGTSSLFVAAMIIGAYTRDYFRRRRGG